MAHELAAIKHRSSRRLRCRQATRNFPLCAPIHSASPALCKGTNGGCRCLVLIKHLVHLSTDFPSGFASPAARFEHSNFDALSGHRAMLITSWCPGTVGRAHVLMLTGTNERDRQSCRRQGILSCRPAAPVARLCRLGGIDARAAPAMVVSHLRRPGCRAGWLRLGILP